MAATLEDIARRAEVSHMTVSLVINNKGNSRVSEATRRRVLQIAREIGYAPNRAAQALVTGGRTHTIAVWIRRFSSPFYAAIAEEMERLLYADGYEIIVRGFGSDRTMLAEWPVDGIIGVDHGYSRPVTATELPGPRTAFVSAGVYCDRAQDHVAVDLATGTRAAVRHLLSQGCHRVAHLINHEYDRPGDARRDAYLEAMQEAGLAPEMIAFPDDVRDAVAPVLTAYIGEHGCPDGLFCRNDELAIGAYRTLRSLGYRLPEDVCLVGCDGIRDTEYLDIPLSTLVTPIPELCRISWDFLRRRMEDPAAPPFSATLTAPLEIRQSSRRAEKKGN